jgi:hypothetical protein
MALTMRPTGLGAGIDKDRPDYTVYSGGWAVGRIYETRGGPDHLRWFWSLTVDPPMARSDMAAMAGVGGAAGNVVAPCIPLLITELRSRLKAAPLQANEFFLPMRVRI